MMGMVVQWRWWSFITTFSISNCGARDGGVDGDSACGNDEGGGDGGGGDSVLFVETTDRHDPVFSFAFASSHVMLSPRVLTDYQ